MKEYMQSCAKELQAHQETIATELQSRTDLLDELQHAMPDAVFDAVRATMVRAVTLNPNPILKDVARVSPSSRARTCLTSCSMRCLTKYSTPSAPRWCP